MALFGAPVNPSIVGILVSAAQSYGKSVHYEAATERILLCDESGALKSGNAELNSEKGVALLFRHGIENKSVLTWCSQKPSRIIGSEICK